MRDPTRILIVEDERDIANVITAILKAHGYEVECAVNGREAIAKAASNAAELLLLDLGLPDIDGMSVLRSIRQWSDIPIIVLSARQDEPDKVEALDAGANDYVTKPFGNSELLARIRTAVRQYYKAPTGDLRQGSVFSAQGLTIDYAKRRVWVEDREIHLTPNEYRIVVLLSNHAGSVLTHDFIISQVWGPYTSDNQLLRVNMANIRRKLEENPADPRYIRTEMGVGYRMLDPDGI